MDEINTNQSKRWKYKWRKKNDEEEDIQITKLTKEKYKALFKIKIKNN